jgi:ankyrin repeat protein
MDTTNDLNNKLKEPLLPYDELMDKDVASKAKVAAEDESDSEKILSISSIGILFGAQSKKMLRLVPDADSKPEEHQKISEPVLLRWLLNDENMNQLNEAETTQMRGILKDMDTNSKITQVEIHQSSIGPVKDSSKAFHVWIVFKTTSEKDGDYWWSLEKNTKYIVLQRSRNKENVKDKLEGKSRSNVKLIKDNLIGKGTIKDLFEVLWAQQVIVKKYHIKNSNCQSLATCIIQQITEIEYEYEGFFPYSPPREIGRDKEMLHWLNHIRSYSSTHWQPILTLIAMDKMDLFDVIVASGKYDINALYDGETPLIFSIRLEKTEMAQHLLKPPYSADPSVRDGLGKSALHNAGMITMNAEIFDLLLAHQKVSINEVDECGRTVLQWAIMKKNVAIVKYLIDKGADLNIADQLGMSPLLLAAQERDGNEIIDLLLAHSKVNVDHLDVNGHTALHWAAMKSNVAVFKNLIDKGANANIKDKEGLTPLDIAALGAEN